MPDPASGYPAPDFDPPRLYAEIGRFLERVAPGATDVRLVYRCGGSDGALPIPLERESAEAEPTSPMMEAVLQVVSEMLPGEVLTGAEIAERAGYTKSGKFAVFLATLVRLGTLVKTGRGYSLPPPRD